MKNTKELPTLPNGLPLWKMMQYKVTGEQCRIVKVNPAQLHMPTVLYDSETSTMIDSFIDKPLTVDIKIIRTIQGIKTTTILDQIDLENLIVWNESINPHRIVTYKTRKHQARTVYYN